MNGKRLNEVLVGTAEILCALLLILIAVLTIAQVIMRYVFSYPFTWSEELCIAAFIYLAFLGIGVAYSQDRHLWVDAFLVMLPQTVRTIVDRIVLGLSAGFLLFVSALMIKVMVVTSKVGITTAALEIPKAFIYLSLPLGMILFFVQVVRKFRKLGRPQ
ncbi:MAG TPA: TRAP transporter small permease [Syntrophorhabdaceae bacterium]|nr:TRAP transporter small permease [Syntrophorhabdaceae bacterium]